MSKICNINEESLQMAAQIINEGGVIVVPTDTVYGVACDPFNEAAVAKIYELKRRPRTKALQILMSGVEDLEKLGLYLPSPLDILGKSSFRADILRLRVRRRIQLLQILQRCAKRMKLMLKTMRKLKQLKACACRIALN